MSEPWNWTKVVMISSLGVVIASEIFCIFKKWTAKREVKTKKPISKPRVKPAWEITRAKDFIPPEMSEEQKKSLEQRKPADVWNTVIIFPNIIKTDYGTQDIALDQLKMYIAQAKTSIYICVYLSSHYDMGTAVLQKFNEGLLVKVISDYDTYTAHNNSQVKMWRHKGIDVRLRSNGYLMHNKFAIIDEEAVLTGSLNWTRQGMETNHENVLVTTDQRIVHKYLKEYENIWRQCGEGYD